MGEAESACLQSFYRLHNSNSQELNRITVIHKGVNSHLIIVCQPRKKWGGGIGDWSIKQAG
jgi:hypothetical protein